MEGGISIPEQNTEDENVDSDHREDDDDGDDDDDPEEDSERTKDSGNNNEDNASEECKKEQFFDFVFEAEEFLDSEYTVIMEEFIEECKTNYKDGGNDHENTKDMPQDINGVIDDVHECSDDLEECGEKCFIYCGKRKIMSMSNMANMLVDPKTVQKLKIGIL